MTNTGNELSNTYSTPEVATLLRISTQRVRQLVDDGRLAPVPGIRPYRFTREALEDLKQQWPRPEGAAGHEENFVTR